MRHAVLERAIKIAMIASATLLAPACSHGDDAANGSNAGDGGGNGGSDDFTVNNAELGDNDMDSNVAQADAANGTSLSGHGGSSAMGNGAQ